MREPVNNELNKMIKIKNLNENELDLTVWRYLPLAKFVSLLTYQALWFCKLNVLQDQYEGKISLQVKAKMHEENQSWKSAFADHELHKQIDNLPNQIEENGRELLVVNCWFLGEAESEEMWRDYVGSREGVAIKSTVRTLMNAVYMHPEFSCIGKVCYTDHDNHEMDIYEAHQAHELALIKDKPFTYEQEIRLITMNIKTAACVSKHGEPFLPGQVAGKHMNNFENPGLYIGVNLHHLLKGVVVAPYAEEWFELLIKRIMCLTTIPVAVTRSELEEVQQGAGAAKPHSS